MPKKSTLNTMATAKQTKPMVKAAGCGICWVSRFAPFVRACLVPGADNAVL
jgi:sporulation killing factor